ncbi:MAG: PIN domain-containing protein [Proteobacteria bacterium]|nr:PIN domain-containing protein [Pseudomonadota bacterium]
MRYLLDTTVISDFTRGEPAVLSRLKAAGKREVSISTVTAMEIEYGLLLNPSRARKIEPVIRALLTDMVVFPYEQEDASATAAVRAALAKRGTPIGPFDLMIAGTALRRGLVMVTSNSNEFARVSGLNLEDWA